MKPENSGDQPPQPRQSIGHAVPKSTVYRLLARHGWRKLAPRPRPPQTDTARQQTFTKTPRDR